MDSERRKEIQRLDNETHEQESAEEVSLREQAETTAPEAGTDQEREAPGAMKGRRLGSYEIHSLLGVGGMGEVYLAEDKTLDRQVALKFLPEVMQRDASARERFIGEAKAIAALDHPNVVTIYGIEEVEGSRFLTMEFVRGESLEHLIPPVGLPLAKLLEIAVPIADAISAAHDKGIIHRDLKPSNVMVADEAQVKLLDFGLAKLVEETEEAERRLDKGAITQEGAVIGTPSYMSPEQLQGEKVDQRTDIFSLGVVLYEMATGRRPFEGKNVVALASSILKDEPPAVSDLRPELPVQLGRIIDSCLAKEPERRFQTVGEVLTQLQALRRQSRDQVAPGRSRLAGGFATSSKWIVGGIAAILVLSLAGYLGWLSFSPSDPNPTMKSTTERKLIAVLPFENLGTPEDEYFADGITEEITSRLAGLAGLGVISRTSAMMYKGTRTPLVQIGQELGVDYVLEGTIRWQHSDDGPSQVRVTPQLIRVPDDTHLWAERYDAVLADIFKVQTDIAKQVIRQLDIALLEPDRRALEARPTESLEAYDFYLKGNDYQHRGRELNSANEIRLAIQMYEEAIRLDPGFALAHAQQAAAHNWLYSWFEDRTESRIALAEKAAERALELDPELPEARFSLGEIFNATGRNEQALGEYQKVLESQPNNGDVFEAIGWVQTYLGQWEEALTSMKTALELNPRLGRLACWTGGRNFALRNFSEGVRYHDRAIRLAPDRACPYYCKGMIYLNWDSSTARTRSFFEGLPENIGLEDTPPINYPWVLSDMIDGRYEDALKRLSEGTKKSYSFIMFYVPKDLLAAQTYGLMNQPDLQRSKYESAREMLEMEINEKPEDGRLHSSLGIAYAGLGRYQDAVREGGIGMKLLGGRRDEPLGFRLKDLVQIYTMVGNHEEAIETLERLVSVPAHFSVGYLKIDPTWAPLRDHPGFLSLLQRYDVKDSG